MNKKNIILGLSLLLSSVSALNLTSCSDDDDDDANHAPKSAVVDNQQDASDFTSSDMFVWIDGYECNHQPDSVQMKVAEEIRNYLQKNILNEAYVKVEKDLSNISIVAKQDMCPLTYYKLCQLDKTDKADLTQCLTHIKGFVNCHFSIKAKSNDRVIFSYNSKAQE